MYNYFFSYKQERGNIDIFLYFQLYNLGFRHLDALDPSEGMLNKARERHIYTNFINDFIGLDNPVPVEDGKYSNFLHQIL